MAQECARTSMHSMLKVAHAKPLESTPTQKAETQWPTSGTAMLKGSTALLERWPHMLKDSQRMLQDAIHTQKAKRPRPEEKSRERLDSGHKQEALTQKHMVSRQLQTTEQLLSGMEMKARPTSHMVLGHSTSIRLMEQLDSSLVASL